LNTDWIASERKKDAEKNIQQPTSNIQHPMMNMAALIETPLQGIEKPFAFPGTDRMLPSAQKVVRNLFHHRRIG
jgi:hypothetical protein